MSESAASAAEPVAAPASVAAHARPRSVLEARFRLLRGRFELDVAFACAARGVTGLFGPSGAGKTTVLRCMAGLDRASDGFLRVGDDLWQDSESGRFLQPHRRSVGYVFQEADLFAHLSVRRNLEFAFRRAADHRIGWDDAVEWLGLGRLLERSPAGLSGGERQRVAVARALLASPRLLLMDEPIAALDEVGRLEILPYLHALPERLAIPIVYVSHSLAEVTRLADHLVWLVDGRVRAAGPPVDVLARLDFAHWRGDDAAVVVDATVREHDDDGHLTLLDGPWGPVWVRRQHGSPGRRVRVQIRASDVSLSLAPEPLTTIMNQFRVRIIAMHESGPGEVLVRLANADDVRDDAFDDAAGAALSPSPALLARITRRSKERLALEEQQMVWARVKSVALLD